MFGQISGYPLAHLSWYTKWAVTQGQWQREEYKWNGKQSLAGHGKGFQVYSFMYRGCGRGLHKERLDQTSFEAYHSLCWVGLLWMWELYQMKWRMWERWWEQKCGRWRHMDPLEEGWVGVRVTSDMVKLIRKVADARDDSSLIQSGWAQTPCLLVDGLRICCDLKSSLLF